VVANEVGFGLVIAQWLALVALIFLEEYHTRRREADNNLTRASNQRLLEEISAARDTQRLVIQEIRQHFPRFLEDLPEEETFI
jgi:histone H3/H4